MEYTQSLGFPQGLQGCHTLELIGNHFKIHFNNIEESYFQKFFFMIFLSDTFFKGEVTFGNPWIGLPHWVVYTLIQYLCILYTLIILIFESRSYENEINMRREDICPPDFWPIVLL